MVFPIDTYKTQIEFFYNLMAKRMDIAEVKLGEDKWTLKEMVGHLIDFWKQYNLFLLHLIQNVDPKTLDHYWVVNSEKKSLKFLIEDYFRHIQWHVDLFNQRVQEIRTGSR